jgi:hypothetical protein
MLDGNRRAGMYVEGAEFPCGMLRVEEQKHRVWYAVVM